MCGSWRENHIRTLPPLLISSHFISRILISLYLRHLYKGLLPSTYVGKSLLPLTSLIFFIYYSSFLPCRKKNIIKQEKWSFKVISSPSLMVRQVIFNFDQINSNIW